MRAAARVPIANSGTNECFKKLSPAARLSKALELLPFTNRRVATVCAIMGLDDQRRLLRPFRAMDQFAH